MLIVYCQGLKYHKPWLLWFFHLSKLLRQGITLVMSCQIFWFLVPVCTHRPLNCIPVIQHRLNEIFETYYANFVVFSELEIFEEFAASLIVFFDALLEFRDRTEFHYCVTYIRNFTGYNNWVNSLKKYLQILSLRPRAFLLLASLDWICGLCGVITFLIVYYCLGSINIRG